MQTDLWSELPPSGGYENNIIAVGVYLRYAFNYPVSNPTAVNTTKVILEILTRHAYLPFLTILGKGSVLSQWWYMKKPKFLALHFTMQPLSMHKLSKLQNERFRR